MSSKTDERLIKAKERVAQLEQQRKLEERREREAEKKKAQRRHYIVGELVEKYFPEVARFNPGTKTENAAEFEPFEVFLSVLASDEEIMSRLKNEVGCRRSSQNRDS